MWQKFKRKIKSKFTHLIDNGWLQFRAYPAYWHSVRNNARAAEAIRETHYLCQQPNPGAGIGHQLGNYNSGLYYSGYFGLHFAHTPFSKDEWENFLGFGAGEPSAKELLRKGYKKIQLPKFDPVNPKHLEIIKTIIDSYTKPKILFNLEFDQGFVSQYPTAAILQKKFFSAPSRAADRLIYASNDFNIAVHVRRGDIVAMKNSNPSVWQERWLDNNYFLNVLQAAVPIIAASKKVAIYVFSQGEPEDFPEFKQFEHVFFCLDMNAIHSFLHMVNADLLISSKSSFSYKPALLSRKIKIVPRTFWHQYPPSPDFILADNEGNFDKSQLLTQLNMQ